MQPVPFAMSFDEARHQLTVAGEVDEEAAIALREALDTHSASFSRPLVVDLSDVDYLPSAAVGVLAKAHKQSTSTGHPIDLVAAQGAIAQRVLQVCALPHRTS